MILRWFKRPPFTGMGTALAAAASRAYSDTRGSVAMLFALSFPVLLMIAGLAVDYGHMSLKKTQLQAAVDAAAVAAAHELHVSNTNAAQIKAVADNAIHANLGLAPNTAAVITDIIKDPLSVVVDAKLDVSPVLLAGITGASGTVSGHAVARVVGGLPLCVLGLEDKSAGAITLESKARMTGNACAVYSNSSNPQGIKSKDAAVLTAGLICSAGGKVGSKTNFAPEPLTDCPPLSDPLASRPPPPVGSCTHNNLVIDDDDRTLSPGVYCGGLRIDDEANVKLNPGIYVIKDGPLVVRDESRLSGQYVGFYLVGSGATFHFGNDSSIDLGAPKDGPMAGLLFFEDRNVKKKQKHEIFSDDARNLLGTIYLSQGRLYIDAYRPIADQSAYTAIIASQVELYAGPHLVLNADYDATDVPAPAAAGTNRSIVLAE